MKKWEKAVVLELGIDKTFDTFDRGQEYVDWCDWNEAENLGLGNEDYTDPNNQPAQHPDWVWCTKHNRWHPKNHGGATIS